MKISSVGHGRMASGDCKAEVAGVGLESGQKGISRTGGSMYIAQGQNNRGGVCAADAGCFRGESGSRPRAGGVVGSFKAVICTPHQLCQTPAGLVNIESELWSKC